MMDSLFFLATEDPERFLGGESSASHLGGTILLLGGGGDFFFSGGAFCVYAVDA